MSEPGQHMEGILSELLSSPHLEERPLVESPWRKETGNAKWRKRL